MQKMISYRRLTSEEINLPLFDGFKRRQVVTKCYRRVADVWTIQEVPFIDDWGMEQYEFLVKCLKNTVDTGGLVYAAFVSGKLKGFVSVEAEPLGSKMEYLDLSSIHVSEDMRGKGIGRELFGYASGWAREHGAKKLYISSHSAVESQAFYAAMGCVDALELNPEHVAAEPYDRQLEYRL